MSEELKPISGRMLIELADLWENESIDIAHPERRACLREHVDTLRMMAGSPRIDTTLHPDRSPTHRCTICGAFWMEWSSNWSLCSKECGPCCDNQAMGEQIVPLIISDLYQRVDPATDAENQRLRAEVEALREALSTLSSYVGAGLGDEKTTPQQFIARINWGINHIEGSAFERAAAIVEDCSKRPSTTWGEVKRALLNVSQALTRKAPQ